MFAFLKPKMTVDGLALVFARVVAKVLDPSLYPKLMERQKDFVSAGASATAINLELGAFEAFNIWSGAALALQKGKISGDHYELFQAAFWRQLIELAEGSEIDNDCSAHRECNFSDFIDMRMEAMVAVTQGVEVSTAMLAIVNVICENLGRTDPPSELMLLVRTGYLENSGNTFDMIAKTRLV